MKVIAIFTPQNKKNKNKRPKKRERERSEGYHLSPFHLRQIAEKTFGKFLIFLSKFGHYI